MRTNGQIRLLVSVRDASEAADAVEAGARLIDVKDPDRGPLGAADPATVEEVIRVVADRTPVSAALGELAAWRGSAWSVRDWARDAPRVAAGELAFVKLGLAAAGDEDRWGHHWQDAMRCLPRQIGRVAVVYADWTVAGSPHPTEILDAAPRLDCRALLIDTFDKSAGSLIDLWDPLALEHFVDAARAQRLLVVLAGSLSVENLSDVVRLCPDYVAVRGAVCDGGRLGRVDPRRVARFADWLATRRLTVDGAREG